MWQKAKLANSCWIYILTCSLTSAVQDTLEIVLVGADMTYNPRESHFYMSRGSQDPLREGKKWLETELVHVFKTFTKAGAKVYVAGPERITLLPFPWFSKHLSTEHHQDSEGIESAR